MQALPSTRRPSRHVTSRHVRTSQRRRGQGGRHVTSRHVTSRHVRMSQAPPWTRRPSRHVTSGHHRRRRGQGCRHVTSRQDVPPWTHQDARPSRHVTSRHVTTSGAPRGDHAPFHNVPPGRRFVVPRNDRAAQLASQRPGHAKGRKGKQRGPNIPAGLLNKALETPQNQRICWGFNLPNGCKAAKPGESCSKGLHVCAEPGCFKPHSLQEHR